MKKSTLFLTGMAALLLSFGLILAACSSDDDGGGGGGGSSFDGSTLAGTTWVEEKNMTIFDLPSMDTETTLKFTSDTVGTATFKVTKWGDGWDDESKGFVLRIIAGMNGTFDSTYNPATKTGTYTRTEDTGFGGPEIISATFTVDVEKKELTAREVDEDGKTDTMTFKLK